MDGARQVVRAARHEAIMLRDSLTPESNQALTAAQALQARRCRAKMQSSFTAGKSTAETGPETDWPDAEGLSQHGSPRIDKDHEAMQASEDTQLSAVMASLQKCGVDSRATTIDERMPDEEDEDPDATPALQARPCRANALSSFSAPTTLGKIVKVQTPPSPDPLRRAEYKGHADTCRHRADSARGRGTVAGETATNAASRPEAQGPSPHASPRIDKDIQHEAMPAHECTQISTVIASLYRECGVDREATTTDAGVWDEKDYADPVATDNFEEAGQDFGTQRSLSFPILQIHRCILCGCDKFTPNSSNKPCLLCGSQPTRREEKRLASGEGAHSEAEATEEALETARV